MAVKEKEGLSYAQAAGRFSVGIAILVRWPKAPEPQAYIRRKGLKIDIEALAQDVRDYPRLSNAERITFEYVMLKGINDSDDDAHRLVRLISGIPAKINLIPFNTWPGAEYERSDWERIERFSEIVMKAGYASPVRTPRGEDILAACGQLKSATERGKATKAEIESGL